MATGRTIYFVWEQIISFQQSDSLDSQIDYLFIQIFPGILNRKLCNLLHIYSIRINGFLCCVSFLRVYVNWSKSVNWMTDERIFLINKKTNEENRMHAF